MRSLHLQLAAMRPVKLAAAVMMFAVLAAAPTAQGPGERTKVLGFSDAGKAALTAQMNAAVKAGDAPAIVGIVVNRDGVLFEGARVSRRTRSSTSHR